MHHPTDRITHTTAFVTQVVEHWMEREMAQLWFGASLEQVGRLFTIAPLRLMGAKCSSVVRASIHGAMGRRIDPFELFLVPASAPQLV